MSRRSKEAAISRFSIDPHRGAFIKLMREFNHSHNPFTVFSDFVEMSAIALSNRFDKANFDVREKRYMEIVGKYSKEEANRFAHMFAELQMCYRERVESIGGPGLKQYGGSGLGDILGGLFMALDLGNDRAGQFFTPYEVSFMMAKMVVGTGDEIRKKGFITLNEPACGSAGMVVAVAEAMHQEGLSYPEQLHATCIDIDIRCVHMAYLQLSLLGIPAIVVHGNALTVQSWSNWYTPAHVIVGWTQRLQRRQFHEALGQAFQVMSKPNSQEPQPAGYSLHTAGPVPVAEEAVQ
jgi:hypothetical protein